MTEKEQRLWGRISGELGADRVPGMICSALTPFSAWWLIGSIVLFIPLALILSFFVQRHAILVQAEELVVVDLSFWRYRIKQERLRVPLGQARVAIEGDKLVVDSDPYYLEPGWKDVGARISELVPS